MGIKKTTEQFIEDAKAVHGDKYDYSLVEYLGAKNKVTIKCNKCSDSFKQSATNHLSGYGCMSCARVIQGDSKRKNLQWFIEKSTEVHGEKYNYDNTEYVESDKKVSINCKYHGVFQQSPNAHVSGKGCEKCARVLNSFVREDYVKMARGRDTILYLLKCFNNEEEFYKIGKTYTSIKQRYKKGAMPYNYIILDTLISDASTVHIKEAELHLKYGLYSYTPKLKFGGYTETYSKDLPLNNTLEK